MSTNSSQRDRGNARRNINSIDQGNSNSGTPKKESSKPKRSKRSKRKKKFSRDKLLRRIHAMGMTEKEWINDGRFLPSRSTKEEMIEEGETTPPKRREAALGLGLPEDAFDLNTPCPIDPLNHAANNAREEFIKQYIEGLILPEADDEDGKLVPTQVQDVVYRIARDSARMFNYKVSNDETFLKHVIDLLIRDSLIVESQHAPGTYQLYVPTEEVCRKEIEERISVEMLFAKPQIIEAQNDLAVKERLLDAINESIAEIRVIRHRAGGFRVVDHSFHTVWPTTPLGRATIEVAVRSIGRYYLRWRILNKVYYGDGTKEYVLAIQSFNDERIKDLEAIREAVKNDAGPKIVESILRRHVEPVLSLLAECERLVKLIQQRDSYDPSRKSAGA